jgi:UDP-N-acetylmuramyl pentapeptide phosphotransferase/UDP-N-acetylglucosamine-1-phosphate transferase
MFLGFLIATLAVIAGTKIATAFLVLSLPIMDALLVIWQRLREGESLFHPDKRHLHFRLLELGWSERQIVAFFFSVTTIIAIIALNTQALGKLFALLLVVSIVFGLLFFVDRKTRLKHENPA